MPRLHITRLDGMYIYTIARERWNLIMAMNIPNPAPGTAGMNDQVPPSCVTTGILQSALTPSLPGQLIASKDDQTSQTSEETEEARIDRLGRERPPQFKSAWAEYLFCYSILASQFMAVTLPFALRIDTLGVNCVDRNISYPASTSSCQRSLKNSKFP